VTGEFQSVTENQALKDAIVSLIEQRDGISFRDFMQAALYHPQLGYYSSDGEKMGPRGDYMTSPELSHVFGTLVGRQLREMWQSIGEPSLFQIIECGAGTGSLCRDILWWASTSAPDFHSTIQYTIVEASSAMISHQRSMLATYSNRHKVDWKDKLPGDVNGCILSNELLDSFAVHRVKIKNGSLREIFVLWSRDAFIEELRPVISDDVNTYFDRLGLRPGEGCTAEVNLQALDWICRAGEALRQGFVMTFDYGYEASDLLAPWRTDGTLMCFYRHNPGSNPYARIGRQDMTAHIDFTSLVNAGENAGLTTVGMTSQSEFLERLGIQDALAPPSEGTDLEAYYARRGQINELLDPAGLGRIRVLIQGKAAGEARLSGLHGGTDA